MPGRNDDDAGKTFSSYDRIKEIYPEAPGAGKKLAAKSKQAGGGKRKTSIYVNNRLEGNMLEMISSRLDAE